MEDEFLLVAEFKKEYFGDLTYKGNLRGEIEDSTDGEDTNLADDHLGTNWENDRLSGNGIVMSYIQATPSRRGGGGVSQINNIEARE